MNGQRIHKTTVNHYQLNSECQHSLKSNSHQIFPFQSFWYCIDTLQSSRNRWKSLGQLSVILTLCKPQRRILNWKFPGAKGWLTCAIVHACNISHTTLSVKKCISTEVARIFTCASRLWCNWANLQSWMPKVNDTGKKKISSSHIE